ARRPHRDAARRPRRTAGDAGRARRVAGRRLRRELRPRHPAEPRADASVDHARPRAGRGGRPPARHRDDGQEGGARDRWQQPARLLCRGREYRRRRRQVRGAHRDCGRGRLAMAVAEAAQRIPRALPAPWWRGRRGALVLVVLGMIIGFLGWKNEYPWPAWLTWNSLIPYLDHFQVWLSNNRNVPDPDIVFRVFNGFSNFLDSLVGWLISFFHRLTWAGTIALGTLVVLRFGGRRAALGVLAAFASFALLGLWEESVETFSLVLAAVALSLLVGLPL